MPAIKDVELTTVTENIDDILAQEALEDARIRSEQQGKGGALERYIKFVSAINFGFILQCSWEASAGTFQFALYNGGPASVVYGSLLAGLGTTLIATSLAEMASMDPTVGAQYRWSANFAPKWNCFFGLMQGWITIFAWICGAASNSALVSNIITGLVQFNYPNYVLKRWHVALIMWAIAVFPFIGNFWFRKILAPLEAVGTFCHVAFFIASIATLVSLAERSTVSYVFQTLTNDVSGWKNPVVSWGIGLLTVTYPLTGCDGILHMSDEVVKARIRIPYSMIASTVLNAIMQFTYMLTVVFTIGDVDRVTAAPLPIIQVYYQATNSKPATNLFVAMLGIVFFISFFNVFASDARLLWAFARDNGLPFSHVFAKVHPTLKLPVNALILIACCLYLLALINIASSTAYNALMSLPALGLYISYFFPILFLFLRRITRSTPIPWGPFRLGIFGPLVNLGAISYILFIIVWLPFPTALPVSASNMNYAGPLVGAVIVGALLDWCISGRKRFQVPIARHVVGFE